MEVYQQDNEKEQTLLRGVEEARNSGYSNNEIREYLLGKGYSSQELDPVVPIDYEELRNRAVNEGYSEEEFIQAAKDRGISNESLDMYSLNGYLAEKLKRGNTTKAQELAKAEEFIKSRNMARPEARKYLKYFLQLSNKDTNTIENNIFGQRKTTQQQYNELIQQGLSREEATVQVRKNRLNEQTADGGTDNPTMRLVAKPIQEGLAGWLLNTTEGALSLVGSELSEENKDLLEYLNWRAGENAVVEGAMEGANLYTTVTPLPIGSISKAGQVAKLGRKASVAKTVANTTANIAATTAQAGLGTYVEARMSGKNREEARKEMLASMFLSVAAPAVITSAVAGAKVASPIVKTFTSTFPNPFQFISQGVKGLKEGTAAGTKALFGNYAVKKTLANMDDVTKKALLESIDELQGVEDKLMLPYLVKDTSIPSEIKSALDVSARGLFVNQSLQDVQTMLRNSLTKSVDDKLEQQFGKEVYKGVVNGADAFTNKVVSKLKDAEKLAYDESYKLYDSVKEIGNKIELSSVDAKEINKVLQESWKTADTIAAVNAGQTYMKQAEKLLSDISLGQDIIASSKRTFKAKLVEDNSMILDSEGIREYFKFVERNFKDKFKSDAITQAFEKSSLANFKAEKKIKLAKSESDYIREYLKTLKNILYTTDKTGRGQKTPSLTKLYDRTKQLKYLYNKDTSALSSKIDQVLSSIEAKHGTKQYFETKTAANESYLDRKQTFDSKAEGGQALGIFNLINATKSDSTALVSSLTGKHGDNFAFELSTELDKLVKAKRLSVSEATNLKKQTLRYLIDAKVYNNSTKKPDSLNNLLDSINSISPKVVEELGGKQGVKILDDIKQLASRYVDIEKTIAPSRFNTEVPQSLGFFKGVLTKLTIGKILTDKELANRALNVLRGKKDIQDPLISTLRKKVIFNNWLQNTGYIGMLGARAEGMYTIGTTGAENQGTLKEFLSR